MREPRIRIRVPAAALGSPTLSNAAFVELAGDAIGDLGTARGFNR